MKDRLNVLVQAYACNPYQGSEEGVGWGWVRAISAHHDLHVLTAEYHREDIESRLADEPQLRDSVIFHYVPHRPWHYAPTPGWKRIENSILKPIMNFAYRLWQRDACRLAAELSRREHFDLVHVITYVGFRFPGGYWKLPLPLVWGPIGGLENTPWRYLPAMGWRGAVMYAGRNVLNTIDKWVLRGPVKAFRKSEGAVVAATTGCREEIRRRYGVDSVVRCEIGIEPLPEPEPPSERGHGEPLRLAWSGLHIPRKALPLLLEALALLPAETRWHLTVLGTGPQTEHWRNRATSLGLQDRIRWTGRIPRSEAIALMRTSHVFVVSSLYDLTSSVVVEALSVGVPVICPDHFGFSDAVDDSCGIKVPVDSIATIRAGLATGIRTLYDDEARRRRLASGALRRASTFEWSETGDLVSRLYARQVA
jgi:glycosyltransferase involved in cell wall biosynthesis